jgi:hypothetical protein
MAESCPFFNVLMSQSITGLGDTRHEAVIPLPGTFDVTRFF